MQIESIKEVLMTRDGMSEYEADQLIKDAAVDLKKALLDGEFEYADNICAEWFGLEPDYLPQLIQEIS